MENGLIRADAIEAAEFPDLSSKYRVMAVPRTIINGEAFIEGALPEDFFLDGVLKTLEPPSTAEDQPSRA